MQEEYLIEKMLKVKSDKELEMEIIQKIIETKRILEVSRKNFEYAEDDLIDYYIYQIKANQAKLPAALQIENQDVKQLTDKQKLEKVRDLLYVQQEVFSKD